MSTTTVHSCDQKAKDVAINRHTCAINQAQTVQYAAKDMDLTITKDPTYPRTGASVPGSTIHERRAREKREFLRTLKMSPLLVGELRARPPRKWTHHSSTSAAAVAASARAALAGAGTAISSGDTEEPLSTRCDCEVKLLRVQSHSA
jgi:hypothetical protein